MPSASKFPTAAAGTQNQEPISGRRQGRRQWLRLWSAARRRERLQRLDHLWDAPHEQMWTQTAYSYRDFVLRERRPALRFAIYQHLALS